MLLQSYSNEIETTYDSYLLELNAMTRISAYDLASKQDAILFAMHKIYRK